MNIVFLYIVVVILLFGPGITAFIIGLSEVLEEKRFRKSGILTEGKVVSKVPVKFLSREIPGGFRAVGQTITAETSGGFFFNIEYEADGESYSFRPKKVFNQDKDKVEILYNRNNPVDIMVDGFYKVGNQKYYRLIAGMVLGVFPFFFYTVYMFFPSLLN